MAATRNRRDSSAPTIARAPCPVLRLADRAIHKKMHLYAAQFNAASAACLPPSDGIALAIRFAILHLVVRVTTA